MGEPWTEVQKLQREIARLEVQVDVGLRCAMLWGETRAELQHAERDRDKLRAEVIRLADALTAVRNDPSLARSVADYITHTLDDPRPFGQQPGKDGGATDDD